MVVCGGSVGRAVLRKREGWHLVFRIKGKKKAAEAAFVQDAVVAVSEEDGVDVSLLPLPPDALQYPEAYQPPPFNTKEVLDMTRWAVPPQTGQILSRSWKSFCHSSKI
jgi:hypothetical protein